MKDNNIYYSYDKVLSYNALLNFLIGERGVGKTYGMTKFLIKQFLKSGKQFVYLRRYKTELKESVPQFFDKIKDDKDFEGIDFKVKKDETKDSIKDKTAKAKAEAKDLKNDVKSAKDDLKEDARAVRQDRRDRKAAQKANKESEVVDVDAEVKDE